MVVGAMAGEPSLADAGAKVRPVQVRAIICR